MQDFRKLQIWQKSHKLTLDIYKLTKTFPKEELYGLTSQLRRAGSSIPTNIAEGCARGSDKDFARFIQIAMDSANETEYLILLSTELGYMPNDKSKDISKDLQSLKKMLTSLIKTLTK